MNFMINSSYSITGNAGAIPFSNWNNISPGVSSWSLIDSNGDQLQTTITGLHHNGFYYTNYNVNKDDGSHGTLFHGYINNFEHDTLVINNIPELFKNQIMK